MKKMFFFAAIFCIAYTAEAQIGNPLNKLKKNAPATPSSSAVQGAVTQPDACIKSVRGRWEAVINVYYKEFKENPDAYIKKSGAMWFPRKDFEVGRYYYTGGKEGFQAVGGLCQMGGPTADPRYKELKALFEEAEAKLKEMETAKGIEFVEIRPTNSVIYKDIKTGKEYPINQSDKL